MSDWSFLFDLIDKLGLVAVLIFLLWQEKKSAAEWQKRYTELSEKLLQSLLDAKIQT
jgi:hypothetical protein